MVFHYRYELKNSVLKYTYGLYLYSLFMLKSVYAMFQKNPIKN